MGKQVTENCVLVFALIFKMSMLKISNLLINNWPITLSSVFYKTTSKEPAGVGPRATIFERVFFCLINIFSCLIWRICQNTGHSLHSSWVMGRGDWVGILGGNWHFRWGWFFFRWDLKTLCIKNSECKSQAKKKKMILIVLPTISHF